MKKFMSLTLVAVLALSSLTGCFTGTEPTEETASPDATASTATSEAPAEAEATIANDKPLNLYVTNEILTLNQWNEADENSFTLTNNFSEGLYRLDENHMPVPALAESVDISEDGMVYTFHLRDGITWSNGVPVTAQDFRYSWLGLIDPNVPKDGAGYGFVVTDYIVGAKEFAEGTGTAEGVMAVAVDDKTLQVTLKAPTPYFLSLTALCSYFPLNQEFLESKGEAYATSADNLLYCGPYILTEFDAASGGKLKKNPDYWDAENVMIENINVRVIKEPSTALNAYNSGEIDMVKELDSSNVDAYKDSPEFGNFVKARTEYIQFNVQDEAMSNLNIRKALSMAYDPEVLAGTILNNGSEAAHSVVPETTAGANGKLYHEYVGDLVTYNPEEAKKYWDQGVAELGYAPELTLLIAEDAATQDAATFLQNEYKNNLGIDVQIDVKTKKARNELMDAGDYQFAITAWGADYDDAMTYLDLWTNGSPYRGNYTNETYNQLIADAKVEADPEARVTLMANAETILLTEDVAISPLYYYGYYYMQKPYVKNLIYHQIGAPVDFKYAYYEG